MPYGVKNAYGTIVSAQSALLSTVESDGLTGENVQAALARSFSTSCCNPSEIEQRHLWESHNEPAKRSSKSRGAEDTQENMFSLQRNVLRGDELDDVVHSLLIPLPNKKNFFSSILQSPPCNCLC